MGYVSEQRHAEIEDRLWDRKTMRVYCDASFNPNTKLMAIAAVFVFDGETQVYTRVLGTQMGNNVVGEIEAVKFAIKQIPVFKRRPTMSSAPETTIVYSDYNIIHQYVKETEDVKIEYMGDDTRQNPFYTAAHNAARKAIFLRPKSGRYR